MGSLYAIGMSITANLDENLPVATVAEKAAVEVDSSVLHLTPDNPMPENVITGFVETVDGMSLRYAHWKATQSPSKGTVILLHGRNEYIEKYFETAHDMLARGFGVLTFDWRGQGGSTRLLRDRQKGYVAHFNQYLTDLETILDQVALPDCKPPHYIMGHSTGGLVSLLAGPALENKIQRMVLVAPMLHLNNLPFSQRVLQRICGVFTFLGLGRSYITRGRAKPDNRPFEGNPLTSDEERFLRNREVSSMHSDLRLGGPTIAWVFAACRAMAKVRAPGYSNAISVPTLLVTAGNDVIVSPAAIQQFGKQMRSGACLTIAGAKHEVLMEEDVFREQLLAAFDAFIPGEETD